MENYRKLWLFVEPIHPVPPPQNAEEKSKKRAKPTLIQKPPAKGQRTSLRRVAAVKADEANAAISEIVFGNSAGGNSDGDDSDGNAEGSDGTMAIPEGGAEDEEMSGTDVDETGCK